MFNSKILDENYQFSVRVRAASEILFRIWISKVIKKTDFITLINPRLIRALHCAVQQKNINNVLNALQIKMQSVRLNLFLKKNHRAI